LRLFEAERVEEVAPILLEEIVKLGYERAFVANVNFETGEVRPTEWVNCSKNYLERFHLSIYVPGDPLVEVLLNRRPTVVGDSSLHHRSLYLHPLVFKNKQLCWEASRERRGECLAAHNYHAPRRLTLEEQTCGTCHMRGYAIVVAVELPRENEDTQKLAQLIEMGNRYLTRLFKVEHYYHRMTDMETTILQMETMMQSMTDPVILTDMHHRVIVQNKAAERFFKLPEEVSEGLVRAVELNTLLFSAALSSISVSGSETSRDVVLVDAIEGEEMLFEAVCTPTFSRDGKALGIVTVMRDVTDLRRADEELRTNYEKLRSAELVVRQDRDRLNLIVENVGDPIVVCDHDAKIVLIDSLAQNLFGVPGEEPNAVQLKNLSQFEAYVSQFTYAFAHRQNSPLKLVNPLTDEEIEYDARSGKILDERNQAAFTVTVLRDLSAVRKMEQLKVERRMLEIEKFAAAGRLAATIAHEVNNPMEAIKNSLYLLEDELKKDGKPVFNVLQAETERVARIVRQMLGLYRNNEQVKPVDINTLVDDTIVLLNRQLQRNSIEVRVELGKIPPAIVAQDQIRQVLSNLVINAKDAMPNGGTLRMRTRLVKHGRDGHPFIRVTIADTGVGVAPEMLNSIFEPFVTTKGEKGTGLGLWIVKGIMANHGGRMKVRSSVSKGTVFGIMLPVVR
jgi:signal transduction histidine kinase